MMLDQKFNLDVFSDWIEGFLPDFARDIRKVEVPSGFLDVKSIITIGESSLGVRVFVIETTKDPSGRKVGLAKDSFSLIKNYGTPNALIAYYSGDESSWRFSLITSTPVWSDGKIITKLSNPKRHSYILGPNAKVNTPNRFLIKNGKILDFTDLKSRFSLEVVNKEFYKEISLSFTKLVGGTRGEGKNKKTYESILKLPSTNDHSLASIEFAVRLIGRVIFCWFLREKISESGSSLMPKELLSLDAISNNADYYHKILEPIFFEVLNKPFKSRKDNYALDSFSQIPYLNGGLFSPHDDDFFSYNEGKQAQFHNTVVVPDDWFREFFSILETYNFTIDENTSMDEDLSIDPEMLGRIFENLLAEINPETGESARKSTGSYYTPRVIVDYMVDESLLLYLKQKTNIDEVKIKAIISYDLSDDLSYPLNENEKEVLVAAIEKVKILDPACGSGAFPIGSLQKIVFILQQIDPDGQIWFHKQIQNTSPEIRRVMEREFSHKNFDYIRKLGIIRENIYGIDIQPIATEISRLRCFLTLVVDERIDDTQENRGIEPLPNLDFKFVTANSLIGLPTSDKKNQMGLFEDIEGISELREIRDMFFNASGTEREMLKLQFMQSQKNMLQRLISENRRGHAELTTMLTTWDPFGHKASSWFDPEWMFGIKDDFDLVIANPPYLGQKGNNLAFKPIKESVLGKFHQRRMDLFYFFFHFALNMGNENSVISFITTNYYPTATYADKLRKDIKSRSNIRRLVNFNELKIFESALGQHNMITIIQKSDNKNEFAFTSTTNRVGIATPDILRLIMSGEDNQTEYSILKQEDLYDGNALYIRLHKSTDSKVSISNVLNKIIDQGCDLGTICNITTGIQTGADKITDKNIIKFGIDAKPGDGVFVLSENEIRNLVLDSSAFSFLKPWYKNSDIYKWGSSKKSDEKLIYYTSKNEENLAQKLIVHFSRFKKMLINRNVRSGTGMISVDKYENFVNGQNYISYVMISSAFKSGKYFCISYARDQQIFDGPKIVVPQRSPLNTFGYNEIPWYASADVYFITGKDSSISLKYILGLLNSSLYYLWLYHRGKRKGETLELYQKPLSEIPIKKISDSDQKPFIVIVDKILELTNSTDYLSNLGKQLKVKQYEKEIDKLVYALYGLSEEEIKVVEDSTK